MQKLIVQAGFPDGLGLWREVSIPDLFEHRPSVGYGWGDTHLESLALSVDVVSDYLDIMVVDIGDGGAVLAAAVNLDILELVGEDMDGVFADTAVEYGAWDLAEERAKLVGVYGGEQLEALLVIGEVVNRSALADDLGYELLARAEDALAVFREVFGGGMLVWW